MNSQPGINSQPGMNSQVRAGRASAPPPAARERTNASGRRTFLVWLTAAAAALSVIVALVAPRFAARMALVLSLVVAGAWIADVVASLWNNTNPELRRINRETERQRSKRLRKEHKDRLRREVTVQEFSAEGLFPGSTAPVPLVISELGRPYGPSGLSPIGQQHLKFVVAERLWKRHRLNLSDPRHLDAIRARLSPDLVAAIGLTIHPPMARPRALHLHLNETDQL